MTIIIHRKEKLDTFDKLVDFFKPFGITESKLIGCIEKLPERQLFIRDTSTYNLVAVCRVLNVSLLRSTTSAKTIKLQKGAKESTIGCTAIALKIKIYDLIQILKFKEVVPVLYKVNYFANGYYHCAKLAKILGLKVEYVSKNKKPKNPKEIPIITEKVEVLGITVATVPVDSYARTLTEIIKETDKIRKEKGDEAANEFYTSALIRNKKKVHQNKKQNYGYLRE